jgi:competence protein ComEC
MVKKISKKWKILYLILALVVILFTILDITGIFTYKDFVKFTSVDGEITETDFEIHFIDVGQGDSELVISGGKTMLIDAGEVDKGMVVVNYLDKLGIEKLDYIIGTHPHSDHIGGLTDLIKNFEVDNVILPKIADEYVPTTRVYENLLDIISEKKLKINQAKSGDEIRLGDATVAILSPLFDDEELNNYSVVTLITYGSNNFLLTGDAEKKVENALLKEASLPKIDVFKAGHHGSKTSNSSNFLKVLKPKIVAIECGDNSYGHPNQEVIDRFLEYTDKIYRTDVDGTIVMKSDGRQINVHCRKNN